MSSDIMNDRPKVCGPEIKDLQFTFFPQGNSVTPMTVAAGTLVNDGFVTSVTRTGTAGTYTIQLASRYLKLLSKLATIQMSAATDIQPQFGDYDAAAGTLVIRALAGATPTDIAANANNSISVLLRFQDSAA
jgi:hypothetical protein